MLCVLSPKLGKAGDNAIGAQAQSMALGAGDDSLVHYRCGGMQLLGQRHKLMCGPLVVAYFQGSWLCCDRAEGTTDAHGQLKTFKCQGDVRVWRGDAQIWAEQAIYDPIQDTLIFNGAPVVQRGLDRVAAKQLIMSQVSLGSDAAFIEMKSPQGIWQKLHTMAPAQKEPPKFLGQVPLRCPLPAAPH